MRKAVAVMGMVVLGAMVCMAGMKTDKVVFGDDTELTSATVSGTPPVTNTMTTAFSQGFRVDGDVAGYDTWIGVNEATPYAIRTSGGGIYVSGYNPNQIWLGADTSDDYGLEVHNGDSTQKALFVKESGTMASFYDSNQGTVEIMNGSYGIYLDSSAGGLSISGTNPGYVNLGANTTDDYQIEAHDGGDGWKALLLKDGTAAAYFTDTVRSLTLCDGNYVLDGGDGAYFVSLCGNNRAGYFTDGTDSFALMDNGDAGFVSDGTDTITWFSGGSGAAFGISGSSRKQGYLGTTAYFLETYQSGMLIDGEVAGYDVYLGVDEATDYALRTTGPAKVDGGDFTVNGEGDAGRHLVVGMDDASGGDCTFVEWGIGGAVDQNDNWRMGVVGSNLVVQVRVSGSWTNATQFSRP